MHFLAPIAGLIAAAVAVPLLVLLYFLKLKRREVPISSTLLWKRAIQDLRVNAPFQRLRRNILLLLQLLVLLAALLALARPVLSLRGGPGRRFVLLIDRSASMNATDADGGTRLMEAKRLAGRLVGSLRARTAFSLQDTSDQAMVVAFDARAKVMCNFTTDKRQLEAAIDSIEPTDAPTALSEALTVAQAFAQSADDDASYRSAEAPAQLELFSDGRIPDAEDVAIGGGNLNFHRVGADRDNVAVVAMQARRSYEEADEVDVFATLANFGPEAVTCDVQLSVDGNVRSVRSVRIPGAVEKEDGQVQAGKLSVSFSLRQAEAGVLEVRHLAHDALGCDDAAWWILQPPKRLSVLLVTAGNVALHSALKACPISRLDVCTPAEFDAKDHAALAAAQPYDAIVLDRHAPAELPRGRYLVFGRPPKASGVSAGEQVANQVMVDWRSRHPVLQYVNLTSLFAARCCRLILPRDAELLAEFDQTPAIALSRRAGSVFLLAGFDVMETNWPFEPGLVMFCYNAMNFLGLELGAGVENSLRVGEAITIAGVPPGAAARVDAPGGADVDAQLAADASGAFRYPATDRAGVYTVTIGEPATSRRFAVNLLDEKESLIAPAAELAISGRPVQPQQADPGAGNRELWPLLAVLALILVCAEWLVYNLKIRI